MSGWNWFAVLNEMGANIVALTTYFNPVHYVNRFHNYQVFRTSLPVALPLIAVECSTDGLFELSHSDADEVIQVRGGVLWQKERLLNIALRTLPASVEYVVWLDCDVVLGRTDWQERMIELLQTVRVAQLYSEACRLSYGGQYWPEEMEGLSLAQEYAQGVLEPQTCRHWKRRSAPIFDGYAWGARRETLSHIEFYDCCIMGGGTRVFFLSAIGDLQSLASSPWYTEEHLDHILRWAYPASRAIDGAVGCLEGPAFHLWHGAEVDRQYERRDYALQRLGFDPDRDLRQNFDGCWEWDDRTDLAELAYAYFLGRNEDGNL